MYHGLRVYSYENEAVADLSLTDKIFDQYLLGRQKSEVPIV